MTHRTCFIMAIALACSTASTGHALLLGPLGGTGLSGEYSRFSDSPFSGGSYSHFYLEDFEDHLFNVPGVSASAGGVTSVVFGLSIHDSVDLDDGVLDGSGLAGDDYFSGNGGAGITFSFSAGALGALPTHAGLVWTDGAGGVTFEAYDHAGLSLGAIGPFDIADGTFSGTTADDRFFGVTDPGGISAIKILNASGGMEVDHLQYGLAGVVPEPSTMALLGTGLVGLALAARRRPRNRK